MSFATSSSSISRERALHKNGSRSRVPSDNRSSFLTNPTAPVSSYPRGYSTEGSQPLGGLHSARYPLNSHNDSDVFPLRAQHNLPGTAATRDTLCLSSNGFSSMPPQVLNSGANSRNGFRGSERRLLTPSSVAVSPQSVTTPSNWLLMNPGLAVQRQREHEARRSRNAAFSPYLLGSNEFLSAPVLRSDGAASTEVELPINEAADARGILPLGETYPVHENMDFLATAYPKAAFEPSSEDMPLLHKSVSPPPRPVSNFDMGINTTPSEGRLVTEARRPHSTPCGFRVAGGPLLRSTREFTRHVMPPREQKGQVFVNDGAAQTVPPVLPFRHLMHLYRGTKGVAQRRESLPGLSQNNVVAPCLAPPPHDAHEPVSELAHESHHTPAVPRPVSKRKSDGSDNGKGAVSRNDPPRSVFTPHRGNAAPSAPLNKAEETSGPTLTSAMGEKPDEAGRRLGETPVASRADASHPIQPREPLPEIARAVPPKRRNVSEAIPTSNLDLGEGRPTRTRNTKAPMNNLLFTTQPGDRPDTQALPPVEEKPRGPSQCPTRRNAAQEVDTTMQTVNSGHPRGTSSIGDLTLSTFISDDATKATSTQDSPVVPTVAKPTEKSKVASAPRADPVDLPLNVEGDDTKSHIASSVTSDSLLMLSDEDEYIDGDRLNDHPLQSALVDAICHLRRLEIGGASECQGTDRRPSTDPLATMVSLNEFDRLPGPRHYLTRGVLPCVLPMLRFPTDEPLPLAIHLSRQGYVNLVAAIWLSRLSAGQSQWELIRETCWHGTSYSGNQHGCTADSKTVALQSTVLNAPSELPDRLEALFDRFVSGTCGAFESSDCVAVESVKGDRDSATGATPCSPMHNQMSPHPRDDVSLSFLPALTSNMDSNSSFVHHVTQFLVECALGPVEGLPNDLRTMLTSALVDVSRASPSEAFGGISCADHHHGELDGVASLTCVAMPKAVAQLAYSFVSRAVVYNVNGGLGAMLFSILMGQLPEAAFLDSMLMIRKLRASLLHRHVHRTTMKGNDSSFGVDHQSGICSGLVRSSDPPQRPLQLGEPEASLSGDDECPTQLPLYSVLLTVIRFFPSKTTKRMQYVLTALLMDMLNHGVGNALMYSIAARRKRDVGADSSAREKMTDCETARRVARILLKGLYQVPKEAPDRGTAGGDGHPPTWLQRIHTDPESHLSSLLCTLLDVNLFFDCGAHGSTPASIPACQSPPAFSSFYRSRQGAVSSPCRGDAMRWSSYAGCHGEFVEVLRSQYIAEVTEYTLELQDAIRSACQYDGGVTTKDLVPLPFNLNGTPPSNCASVRAVRVALGTVDPEKPGCRLEAYMAELLAVYFQSHKPVLTASGYLKKTATVHPLLKDLCADLGALCALRSDWFVVPSDGTPPLSEIVYVDMDELAKSCPRVLGRRFGSQCDTRR